MKIYTDREIASELKKRKRRKKLLKIVLYPLIAIIIFFDIYLMLQSTKNQGKDSLFGIKAFNINSESMKPTLKKGELVLTKEKESNEIKSGDIITFKENEDTITRRVTQVIIENGKTYYKTKDDDNDKENRDRVRYEEVEGVCILHIPKIGKLIIYHKQILTIATTLIIIYFVYKIIQKRANKKFARHEIRKKLEK